MEKIKIEKKRKFDFMLNGHNVRGGSVRMGEMSTTDMAKTSKRPLVEWERLVATGMDSGSPPGNLWKSKNFL